MKAVQALRTHWPEYLIEGWALGSFMISAGLFTLLLEYPASPLRQAIEDPHVRHGLSGVAMGLTAITLIYSRWGKRSGAHMNPAVTLSFLRLGKIAPVDAMFYIAAQFIGGTLGVMLVARIFGHAFAAAPVAYVMTMPGEAGVVVAVIAEFIMSAGMMLMVLLVSNNMRLASATGLGAGLLVAIYITFAAPVSGMSINPARSFASAVPAGEWQLLWIYFAAPILGMLAVAELYLRVAGRSRAKCAKLLHPEDVRCIHCGHTPIRHEQAGPHSLTPLMGNQP